MISKFNPPRWTPASPKLGDFFSEAKSRMGEYAEPLNFILVSGAWTALDFVGHQAFELTKGEKTPPYYYGRKFLWGIPFLLVGRFVSDYLVKGSKFVRAATIATVANSLMQIGYIAKGYSFKFNATVFLIHEAVLIPLSFLIVGPSPMTGKEENGGY